jgi:hypothetical protein
MKKYYAGVGSRGTPDDILLLMIRLGRTLADVGYTLSSGDAIGADRAFWFGATLSPRHAEIGCRIYLHKDGYQGRFNNPKLGFLVATQFRETWDKAQQIASAARGGFYGLGAGGIALHTRNVFQIYGHTLRAKVGSIYFWGEPKGKQEKVNGGTNTALQLAIKANLPQRINLFYPEMRARAEAFLAKYETKEPYPENILESNPWIKQDLPLPESYPHADTAKTTAPPAERAPGVGVLADAGTLVESEAVEQAPALETAETQIPNPPEAA